MFTEDELLASVMRKAITQRHDFMGCYIDICSDSVCIDGWVENLTPEEVQALNKVYQESKDG